MGAFPPLGRPRKTPAALAQRKGKGPVTAYSEIVADRILERISKGEPLTSVCKDSGMPTASTVAEWYVYPDELARPGFAARFARAERIGLHIMAEDMLNIADDSGKDTVTKIFRGKRVKVIDQEHINRDRLRVQTRQFILSKKLKEVYGDNVKHEHTGSVDLVARLNAGRQRAQDAKAEAIALAESASDVIIDATPEMINREDV